MRRREFIAIGSGVVVGWPLVARAQQLESVRKIGAFIDRPADDPEATLEISAFTSGLQASGWSLGRNVMIDYRWDAGTGDRRHRIQTYATELVGLSPDILLGVGGSIVRGLERATGIVPIVFVGVTDPVGGGLVVSLARPSGNATGLSNMDSASGGKLLELVKQIAPALTRVAVLLDPTSVAGRAQFQALQSAALSFALELSSIDSREAGEIEQRVVAFGSTVNGGLIVAEGTAAFGHRELIISLAAQLGLPSVYPKRQWITAGGLISYGPDHIDQFRIAATYVDRILKGEKPADLPVQAPTKIEMIINLKTAKTLGLILPSPLLVTADEVIE